MSQITKLKILGLVCLLLAAPQFIRSAEPIEKEHFIYYFDNTSYVDEADSILTHVRQQMIDLVWDSLSYKGNIYLVNDIDEFNRLIRGRIPDWGAAAAFPERRLIAIKSPDKFSTGRSLKELLGHEYSHLVLAERTGFERPPRWLDEGLAMMVSRQWGWLDNMSMSRAGTFGQFITLHEIEFLNRFGESKAQVGYAESYLAVDYLFKQYGVKSLNRLLDGIASGVTLDSAMNAAVGGSYSEFEEEFEKYLSNRYNIASLFMDTVFFWLFLAIVVIVAGFLRFKKRREYYRKWEQQEKYESTDFDYGDPEHPEQTDEDDEPWRN